MSDFQHDIKNRLKKYKQKYFVDKLIKGLIITGLVMITLALAFSAIEAGFRLGSVGRGLLFFTFVLSGLYMIGRYLVVPIIQLFRLERSLSNEAAANTIGRFFPIIGDRLVNYLQLSDQEFADNELANASMMRRAENLSSFKFSDAIDKSSNKKRLKLLVPALVVFILVLVVLPQIFVSSTNRIVNYDKEFLPEAPFTFEVQSELEVFRNEDYLFQIDLTGEAIPTEVFIINNERKTRMKVSAPGKFEFLFRNIQQPKVIRVEGAGFMSPVYAIRVVDRPALNGFQVNLNYPGYLRKANEVLENVGSFEVPEGTEAAWTFNSVHTEHLAINFSDDSVVIKPQQNGVFEHNRKIMSGGPYEVELTNQDGTQQGQIVYEIQTIKDGRPNINVNVLKDTLLFRYVVLAGNISDDYGIRRLRLNYNKNGEQAKRITIPIASNTNSQSFFHNWQLDTLGLKPGEKIQFYLEVFDNDGVNGSKSTRSATYELVYPSREQTEAQINQAEKQTKEELQSVTDEARELKESLEELTDKLKSKKELSWQDEKLLEELLEQREKINEEIKKLQEENKQFTEQQKKFQEQSENIQQKQEQLQELMDDLLDEETKQLYDELRELLENYERPEEVQQKLEELNNKEMNLEQELERTLELFKRLQYEQKLEQNISELDTLAQQQENLAEDTKDKQNNLDSLAQKQEQLNKEFQESMDKLSETKELNQDLKRPNSFEDTSGDEQDIKNEQKESSEYLENKKRNKSSESQKSASDKMKKMSQKLQQMQSSMQMQQMQEDLGDLEAILNNLITLSFDQEEVMREFRGVKQSDPSFISLSQEQLKLKDDARIIEDSLQALATRVMAISSFVTRELNEMKTNMDESVTAIRDRQKPAASSKQQLAMTSMNNLALMLDDVMRQMQQNMSDAMGNPSSGDPQEMPGLSELQEKLNQQIRELKQSGKTGKELSEELAKLAAEQEQIRKALEESEEKYGDQPGGMGDLLQKMEETEIDLVNKNLTQETLKRQQEIVTRLLEADEAMREREQDSEREAKTAVQYEKELPKAFEEYLKQREKEIELLKTVPVKLLPYYKNEVNLYFERLKETDTTEFN